MTNTKIKNKGFSNYLAYIQRKKIRETIIYSIFAVLMTIVVVGLELNEDQMVERRGTGMYMPTVVLCICTTVIPIIEMSQFQNRRNLDLLYSIPLNRNELALAHYISGLSEIWVIYTLSYVSGLFRLIGHSEFSFFWLFVFYFAGFACGIIIYSVFMFISFAANTAFDSAVFCGGFGMLPAYAFVGVISYLDQLVRIRGNIADLIPWGFIYGPSAIISNFFIAISEPSNNRFVSRTERLDEVFNFWPMLIVWGLVAAGAIYGYFRLFGEKRAEKAGDISDTWFGYKTLIPAYGLVSFLFVTSVEAGGFGIFLSVLIFIMMFAAYFAYRRNIRLKKSDIIVIVSIFAAAILLYLIMVAFRYPTYID